MSEWFGPQPSVSARVDGLIDRDRSLLLIVDVQEKLAPHILGEHALMDRVDALIAAAKRFAIPRIATEHCPGQIGPMVARLRRQFADSEVFAKTRFGAAGHPRFVEMIEQTGRRQLIVAGMEAHVCLMQTALGLRTIGLDVFIVSDATGARAARQEDRRLALDRLRGAGCTLVGTETVLFEWTAAGDDAAFRDVLALVKALPP